MYACKKSNQYYRSVFHTPIQTDLQREDSPTAQWERHRDRTQTGRIKIYFEEYRVYVSCVSEISKAHFCINLHLSAVCMHVVQTICQTNCSIDGYKYTLNNVEQDNMKYHRLKNMYERHQHITKIISQAHSLTFWFIHLSDAFIQSDL